MMRRFVVLLALVALVSPSVAPAQGRDETLADIRQELSVLYVELQKLKRELSTTGSTGEIAVGQSLIDRVTAIEGELQRLTSKTEELEFRIDSVVRDGTNRIGDLEFRLCELEANCDIAQLQQGTTLGGVEPATGTATATIDSGSPGTVEEGPLLAVGEQADFDAAKAAFEAGEHARAAELFAAFQQNYPGGPMSGEAGLLRGQALEQAGEMSKAARAYLDTFSAAPTGPVAPETLYLLGRALGKLGQVEEACVTLGEVSVRFPGGAPSEKATAERQALGCL